MGPISPYDPDRRHELSGAVKRRREKRVEDQETEMEADEFVAASEASEAEAAGEPVQDYYQSSEPEP